MGQRQARLINRRQAYDVLSTVDTQTEIETIPIKELRMAALGTGGSGKTLTLKRLRNMVDGFSKDEQANHKSSIISNMSITMVNMINYAFPKDKDGNRDFSALVNRESRDHVLSILEANEKWGKDVPQSVIHGVHFLWVNEPIFHEVYEKRHEIQYPCEHAVEMIEKFQIFLNEEEEIDTEWSLKAQLKTVGICSSEFLLEEGVKIKWTDTGGQFSERKKWKHVYPHVDGVVYFVSLSEFLECLYEDERTCRMLDAIDQFEKVVNEPALEQIPIVLLLNKLDLFKKRIQKFDLSWLFPSLPRELRINSNEDRSTDEFVMKNVMFIAEQYLSTVKDPRKREWIRERIQIGSMINENDFKRVTDACVEIFGNTYPDDVDLEEA